MSSGSKKKNPDMHSLFLSKIPVNEPFKVPQQGLYGDSRPFTRPFLHIPQIPYKIPPNKEIYSSLKGPRKGASLRVLQKQGSYGNTSISRALLSTSLGITSKGALLTGSPHLNLSDRDAPFLQPSTRCNTV